MRATIAICFMLTAIISAPSAASANDLEKKGTDNVSSKVGTKKTALMSLADFFCGWTEWSAPHAYVVFALQMNGAIKYFKTNTTCENLKPQRDPIILGENVMIYGQKSPDRIKRENGEIYSLEAVSPAEVGSRFGKSVFSHPFAIYDNPRLWVNVRPEELLAECRMLKNSDERDACLWYQAGSLKNKEVCQEMSDSARTQCVTWLDNIENGKINK